MEIVQVIRKEFMVHLVLQQQEINRVQGMQVFPGRIAQATYGFLVDLDVTLLLGY